MLTKKFKVSALILFLLAFAIPIEHKYDKVFRFFSLTLIPENLSLPRSFDPKIYFYASDIAALVLFVMGLVTFRSRLRKLFFEKGSFCLWILFFCAILSISLSPYATYPLFYIRLLQLLTPIFLFSFIAHAFSVEEKQKITSLLFIALIAAALFQSAIAITQYFEQSSLGLRILGEQKFGPQIAGSCSFGHTEGSRWIFDTLFSRTSPHSQIMRAYGTMPHPNVLGGFLMIALLACYPFYLQSRKAQVFLSLVFPFLFFSLCITYSRAALFAWTLGTLCWIALQCRQRGFLSCVKDRSFMALFLLILASASISFGLLKDQYMHRGGVLNYNQTARGSDHTRLYYQDIALRMIQKKPLFGVGYQQIGLHTADYLSEGQSLPKDLTATHNIYLYLAAETGLIALGAFLFFIGTVLRAALRTPFTPFISALIAMFLSLLFIGGCDFYPILFQQGKLLLFCTAGLLAANAQFEKKELTIHPLPF